jgi:S-adenosylmethionine synthetase
MIHVETRVISVRDTAQIVSFRPSTCTENIVLFAAKAMSGGDSKLQVFLAAQDDSDSDKRRKDRTVQA